MVQYSQIIPGVGNMSQKSDSRPVAVFDSGLGGLSVLACARALAPEESFIYLADLHNAPYGEKSLEEIRACVDRVFEQLMRENVKALLVACNTATASSVAILRRQHPDFPIIGMEPALKTAATQYEGGTAVLATPATLSLGMYARLKARFESDMVLRSIPCPGLSHMIDTDASEEAIREYLYALLPPGDPQIRNIVLGCTHYVLIAPLIKRLYPDHHVINGNLGTVRHLLSKLNELGLSTSRDEEGSVRYLCTEEIPEIEQKMAAIESAARELRVWETV